MDTSEDAGVYRLSDELALVQTADFITPVVDDPYDYGQVAVANALSDVYAMGGKPITAVNLLMFDTCRVPEEFLTEILRGGADKLREAGVSLVGGHTVDDLETKYGLSVTGTIHPEKIVRNSTAKPGDFLVYTKPLGIGVLTTAVKADMATEEEVERVTEVMVHLNKIASEVMVEVGVSACTDVTGFGFLGHLYEMVKFSGVGAEVYSSEFLILEGALNYAGIGLLPAATYDNEEYVGGSVVFPDGFNDDLKMLLFDPQTSGGLLISVPEEKLSELLEKLKERGELWSRVVGRITGGNRIEVR
jgi:selenide,water dikinase